MRSRLLLFSVTGFQTNCPFPMVRASSRGRTFGKQIVSLSRVRSEQPFSNNYSRSTYRFVNNDIAIKDKLFGSRTNEFEIGDISGISILNLLLFDVSV